MHSLRDKSVLIDSDNKVLATSSPSEAATFNLLKFA